MSQIHRWPSTWVFVQLVLRPAPSTQCRKFYVGFALRCTSNRFLGPLDSREAMRSEILLTAEARKTIPSAEACGSKPYNSTRLSNHRGERDK
ncbi:hypothetical protein AVEN_64266-1 [Araneus ventricosus]|uniref:Uncharacterized protein n=1 Tax=Araneus ventricosus TaxID=182803 RepID=A0A4Y2UDJ3_ARAVE|nr:hypothetical protein AVEN_64266-1 [Araneus ventricosus]